MANYYGTARTNYFAVKDPEKFMQEMSELPCEVIQKKMPDGETLYGVMDNNADGGGMDWTSWDEFDEPTEIDWLEIFSRHLVDGHVAVLMEAGAEKHRYVIGYAHAVNSKNERVSIDLDDIYDRAAVALGSHITQVSY